MTDRLPRIARGTNSYLSCPAPAGLLSQDEINRIELLPELSLGMAQRRNFIVRVTSSGLARVWRMCYTGDVQGSACTRFCLPQSAVVDNVCPDPEQARQTVNDGLLRSGERTDE